jgi:peroxiredoxin
MDPANESMRLRRSPVKRFALFIACLAVVGGLAACSEKKDASSPSPAPPTAGAVKGQPAPDFTLVDMEGKSHRLSDYRGKVVLLNFWATWCPPCREEIPSMVALNRQMAGRPFAMLCASIDEGGKPAVQEYYAKSGNSLPTLLDTESSVATLYGTTGVPETYVIDKNGIIQEKAVGAVNWTDPQIVSYLNGLLVQ